MRTIADDQFSDQLLDRLRQVRKIKESASRERTKGQQVERNFECVSEERADLLGGEMPWRFRIFTRRLVAFNDQGYSAGLVLLLPDRELVLCRYNGKGHYHTNQLERDQAGPGSHIHITTHRYIVGGKKPDGYAMATNRYNTLEGALYCLVTDCNVGGILSEPGSPYTPPLFT